MELLQNQEDRGYPAEYLLSRIRGRRSRLIPEWRPLVFENVVMDYLASSRYQGFVRERTPENLWRNLVKEYRWVYLQMNEDLRKMFRPFFVYSELRTLFIGLRHMKDGKAGTAEDLLQASLLSDEIKRLLTSSSDSLAAMQGIERAFLSLSEKFGGLMKTFEAEGLRGAEQKITNTYLAVVSKGKLTPVLKNFFSRLIDSRNIMSTYKYLRLEHLKKPFFIPGGAISESRLKEVMEKEDVFAICPLVREFCRIKIDTPDPTKVEMSLYKGITDYLRKEGREPFGVGLILDYLWRCSLEVMNLNVLVFGKDLEREAVIAELS